MGDIYTKVKHTEYMNLLKRCGTLENEKAQLKAELQKLTAKVEKADTKTEAKKGGNK